MEPAPRDLATDRRLLLAARRGDDAAARVFWAEFAPRLAAVARGLLARHGQEHAASDAVQTVMLALMKRSVRELEAVRDVPAFLVRSVRHAALNQIREQARRDQREARRPPAAASADPPDHADHAHHARLRLALAALPDEAREILVLKHFGGLTFDQLAEVLDVPRGTASSRYRSALDQLRVTFAGRWPAHPVASTAHSPAPSPAQDRA